MKTVRTVLLAGAAALLLSSAYDMAAAKGPETHVMTIRLPGGGVEEIRYTGNVAPHVTVSPEAWPVGFGWPVAFFGPDSAFAEMQRISAQMDRQMDAALRNAESLADQPGVVTDIDTASLPAGSQGYSFASTMSGTGVCGKSVEITARAGQKPQVVSKTWGNCGGGHGGAGVHSAAPAQSAPSDVREIRYDSQGKAPAILEAGLF